MHGRLAAFTIALGLTFAGAGGTALAAYAPKLSVKLDPVTPGSTPAITSVVTQAGSETASKKVVVSFPAGFGASPGGGLIPSCTNAQRDARACPPETKVGTADATASVFGLPVELTGTVYKGELPAGGVLGLIVFLDNNSLDQHVTVQGVVTVRPDQGLDTTFDNLPAQTTSSFKLALMGGDRGLTIAPQECGTYTFKGAFTSQNGEKAASDSSIDITGCPKVAPKIFGLELEPERPRQGRGGKLTISLSEAAEVRLIVKRGSKKVLDRKVAAKKGDTVVRKFANKLKAGAYRLSMVATDSDGQSASKKLRFTIAKKR